MSKQSCKKQRHSSLIDVPFTQRTAYFKQEGDADPYRTLPSRTAFKNLIQNENIPFQNKYINQIECMKGIQEKLMATSKLGQRKNSLKKVTNSCFKEIAKGGISVSDIEGLQKRIESIVQNKIRKLLDGCIERYFFKFLEEQKDHLTSFWIKDVKELNTKVNKVEKGYDEILQTYDNFLVIVEKIKDKSFKSEKYVRKVDFQSATKKTQHDIAQVKDRLQQITSQLQNLKRSDKIINSQEAKIKPLLLKYESKELELDELRVVVETYNQNFMQIDQKLQEIYSYFT